MKVKVYAKLNLTLNVLGANNGYHNIDSVATSVDIYDVVEVLPRADKQITVSGCNNISTEQNTAYKAADGFIRQFDTNGVDIVIDKHIPVGAGLGGSSADAAAVVYCMCGLFDVDINSGKVSELCASVGSDINFMLRGGLGRLKGKGDNVTFYKAGRTIYFALTVFPTAISTAKVYSKFDEININRVYADNSALLKVLKSGNASERVFECFNNHLQSAAIGISDYASDYLEFCNRQGISPNMTGSGSAYYVAFYNEQSARNTADLLNGNGFKTVVCKSVDCGIEEY